MTDDEKTVEEMLKKAYEPARKAMIYHPFYRGKTEVVPKAPVTSLDDFSYWYTPGVAEPCRAIEKDQDLVYEHTNKWNSVAVVSDGTRVLGLGDIGPEAALPVMEGKAMLFKYLGGVDAVPICLDTKDPDKIIETVRLLAPSFGGINLEDISMPKCFDILDELRNDCKIPVWHDDQQGTATIVTAGAMNAFKVVGKRMGEAKVAMIGAGAANIAISRLLVAAGIKKKNIIMCDSKGTLHAGRKELEHSFKQKWDMCLNSNGDQLVGDMKAAMTGADLVVAASRPGPGTVPADCVSVLADDGIMFATANPIPEIWPWEAKEAGVRIMATGRSDFPNQVNNSLGFPGIFRGTLDVRASTITDEMCIAAAASIARTAEELGDLAEDNIVPTMSDQSVFINEAVAVAEKAMEQGLASLKRSRQDLYESAEAIIKRAQGQTQLMMDSGYIAPFPE